MGLAAHGACEESERALFPLPPTWKR